MPKFVNASLAIVIAVLVVLIVRANQQGQRSKKEYDRLAKRHGALTITDETKFHVVFSPTEKPKRQFRWRLYHPVLPNGLGTHKRVNGNLHESSFAPKAFKFAGEFLVIANFRIQEGKPKLYISSEGGSSVMGFPSWSHDFLADHWDQLDFQILAENESAAFPVTEALPLLVVKVPESLRAKLPEQQKQFDAPFPIFELFVGDAKALNSMP